MTPMISFLRILFVLSALGFVYSPVLQADGHDKPKESPGVPPAEYIPDDTVLDRLDEKQAAAILLDLIARRSVNPIVLNAVGDSPQLDYLIFPKDAGSMFTSGARVSDLQVRDGKIAFRLNRDDRGPSEYVLRDLPRVAVVSLRSTFWGVMLSDEWILVCRSSSTSRKNEEHSRSCARLLADSLYSLIHAPRYAQEFEQRFKEIVQQYRSNPGKPAFPEDARRFRVQAEFAVEQKRFEDAVRFYREALKAAPWWPEGHFNRGLVLAEVKRYPEAIAEMKRFLALEPNHPQARAAQDQIYRWESVVASSQAAPFSATSSSSKGVEPCRSVFGCAQQQLQH
jgi:tetratricopeptide (TPR) repeat protein